VSQPAAKRRGSSAGRVVRWILIVLLLFLVIAVIVGLIALSNDAGDNIDSSEVIQQEVDQQITRLQDFIDQNTAPE
jgi:flagellar basal body-associated protein FliL